MTVANLIDAAKKLSPAEQVELRDAMVDMVENDPAALDLTPAQQADLDRRIEEIHGGKAKLIPGEEAFARLRARR